MPSPTSVALTIAGSDNSAGAGVQADLKTFTHFRVYGLTVVTCVVAEVPGTVAGITPIPAERVRQQLDLSLRHFPVAALKTGMLYSPEIIDAVCDILERLPVRRRPLLVVDPVMVASSGARLLEPSAIDRYEKRLFPLATVITPNLDEAGVLLKRQIANEAEMANATTELTTRFGRPFLVKGGHLRGSTAVDMLATRTALMKLTARYVAHVSTHGTGCTYSAAIAANLALGKDLIAACRSAKRFVSRAIAQSFRWKSTEGPTDALRHW
jgi:hydroxymethylpyrimidine/phosphomethylpyrimidine kinase